MSSDEGAPDIMLRKKKKRDSEHTINLRLGCRKTCGACGII